jgi:hypothetical protein
MTPERVVLGGAVAQRPHIGGHTWVFLQYLLGLRQLGWDVLLVDRLTADQAGEAGYFVDAMERFGLGDAYSVLLEDGETLGRSRADAVEHARTSAALMNVMGFIDDEEILGASPLRVFFDIDPGFGQMWRELGLADPFEGHDAFVTVGENVGREGCGIPTCGLEWITTPQPVVLDQWPAADGAGGAFTSVGAWRGPYDPVEFRGKTYGLRVHEFRRFLDLPARTGQQFEVALDIDSADEADIASLRDAGWRLVDPAKVAASPEDYREYLRGSAAELMIAKNIYVDTRSGWFSDRSICYLACGRPVVAQDTGFRDRYPVGEGLLAFSDLEEARAGVEEIVADPLGHGQAARALAEEHFRSDLVLPRILGALGIS